MKTHTLSPSPPSLPAWESLLQFNFPLATIKARSLTCCTRVSLCVFTSGIAGSTQAKKKKGKERKEEQRNKGHTDKQIQNKQTSSRLPKKARQTKKKKGSRNAYEAEIKTLSSVREPNKAAKFVNKHMSNSRSPLLQRVCASVCVRVCLLVCKQAQTYHILIRCSGKLRKKAQHI